MIKSVLLFPFKCIAALLLTVTGYVILAALALTLLIGGCYAVGYVLKGGTHVLTRAHEAVIATD